MCRDECGLLNRRRPSRRLPVFLGNANGKYAIHHEDEVERPHGQESVRDRRLPCCLEVCHQLVCERATDHRSSAEAHYGEAGREPRSVWEPLDQCRDGRDVPQPKSNASNHTVSQIDQRELVCACSYRRDIEPSSEADRSIEHRATWAHALQPGPEERCRDAEECDGDREDETYLLQAPDRS